MWETTKLISKVILTVWLVVAVLVLVGAIVVRLVSSPPTIPQPESKDYTVNYFEDDSTGQQYLIILNRDRNPVAVTPRLGVAEKGESK